MGTSEETMRMERIRTCIFRIMLALSVVDLSAHSEAAAQAAIASWATITCGPQARCTFQQFNNDEVQEACMRVAICLGHMNPSVLAAKELLRTR